MSKALMTILASLTVAACGGKKAAEPTTTGSTASTSTAGGLAACIEVMTKSRECPWWKRG